MSTIIRPIKPLLVAIKASIYNFESYFNAYSFSFEGTVQRAGKTEAIEVGVAMDNNGRLGLFYGTCSGATTSLHGADINMNVGIWHEFDSIPGESNASGLGIDLNIISLAQSWVHNTEPHPEFIGMAI